MSANEICQRCANAIDGCTWSRRLEPVDGWTAEWDEGTNGWHIAKCPEYKPDSEAEPRHICFDGYVNLLCAVAKEAGKEYRDAKEALESARRLNVHPNVLAKCEARFKVAADYIEGYERCAELPDPETIAEEDQEKEKLRKEFETVVLNDPNRFSSNKRMKLANSKRKAQLISKLKPCAKCVRHSDHGCNNCDFLHSNWKLRITEENEEMRRRKNVRR